MGQTLLLQHMYSVEFGALWHAVGEHNQSLACLIPMQYSARYHTVLLPRRVRIDTDD